MKLLPYFLLILAFSLFSCQEVVELELETTGPQLVVDATLTNTPVQNQVILTRSGSYYEPGDYATVSDAVVEISSSDGQSWLLTEAQPGVYTADGLIGQVGKRYTLRVESEGQVVSGQSDLLAPVALDSLTFEPLTGQGPGLMSDFLMRAHFDEPAEEQVYLRFLVSINDTLDRGIYLYSGGQLGDSDGLAAFPTLALQAQDEVTITALRIDRAVYDYFLQLAEVAGLGFGPASAAPANPESNLSGEALGYFGATSATRLEAQVP